jgi:GAF domain-containing protein
VDDPSRACLLHEGFDRERGFRTGLRVPVMADGQLMAMLMLFSCERNAYANQDLALAQQIADYVAVGLSHQRLAEPSGGRASRDRSTSCARPELQRWNVQTFVMVVVDEDDIDMWQTVLIFE